MLVEQEFLLCECRWRVSRVGWDQLYFFVVSGVLVKGKVNFYSGEGLVCGDQNTFRDVAVILWCLWFEEGLCE